jgi:hypothetical protein
MSGFGPWQESPLLTPEAARSAPQRALLDRVDEFRRRHPEIKIAAPYTVPSRKWEVSEPSVTDENGDPLSGDPTRAYGNGTEMMNDLEQRYPNE